MWDDLFNVEAGAHATQAMDADQADSLLKTLSVGHGYLGSPTSLIGGGALVVESVDSTLKSVTYDATNLVMWPSVAQDRAYALVEQYVRTNAYGDMGSPYIPESGSPQMNDSEYNRHAQKVVFFSTRRGVSLASTLVRQQFGGDVEGRETMSGTLWMLERLERELYKGLADFSNAGKFDGSMAAVPVKMQNLALSGAEQQIRIGDSDFTAQARAFDGFGGQDTVILSKDGDILNESDIETEANRIVENFGRPSELHVAPKQLSDFIKQFFPKERVNQLGIGDGRAGYVVRTMATTAGDIALRPNVFLKPKDKKMSQAGRIGVPGAPADLLDSTSTSVASGGGGTIDQASDPNSKLKSGDVYVYEVTAANEQGEGTSSIVSKSVTISSDGNNDSFTISDPSSGPTPTHYAVYRTSSAGSGDRKFVGYVSRTGASTKFTDLGLKSEGAASAYMLDMRSEQLVWKQLAPMLKINLAPISTAKEFLLWIAGCMIVYAPRKQGIIENIGRA